LARGHPRQTKETAMNLIGHFGNRTFFQRLMQPTAKPALASMTATNEPGRRLATKRPQAEACLFFFLQTFPE
jgi:hypothetical protein